MPFSNPSFYPASASQSQGTSRPHCPRVQNLPWWWNDLVIVLVRRRPMDTIRLTKTRSPSKRGALERAAKGKLCPSMFGAPTIGISASGTTLQGEKLSIGWCHSEQFDHMVKHCCMVSNPPWPLDLFFASFYWFLYLDAFCTHWVF